MINPTPYLVRPPGKRVTRSSTQNAEENESVESSKSDTKVVKPEPKASNKKDIAPAFEESDYKKMQDTHIQTLEREISTLKTNKMREQNKEYDSGGDDKKYKSRLRGGDNKATPQYNVDDHNSQLESILRDYNTQQ